MKTSVKKLLCAVTAAALFFSAVPVLSASAETPASADAPEIVEGETIDDGALVYTKARKKGCVYVTSCQSKLTDISIPAEIDGYKILGIYDGAFAGTLNLNSISIDDTAEYIGPAAFYQCENLAKVNLPKGITKIPDNCFFGCKELKKIEIPETVTSLGYYSFAYSGLESFDISENLDNIGNFPFMGCRNLEAFNVSENNTHFQSSDGVLYSNNMKALEIFPAGKKDTSFNIPESVSFIQPGAFHQSALEVITMTNNVQWIGATAFSASEQLEKITLSDNIAIIGEGTFSDCSALKSIDIPDTVTSIGDYAFYGCGSLKSVEISDSVETIGENAFGMTDDMGGKEHKVSDFKIIASHDSAGGKYAREKGLSADYTDGNPYTPFIVMGSIAAAIIAVVVIFAVTKKKSSSGGDGSEDDDLSDDGNPSENDDDEDGEESDDSAGDENENDENYTGSDIEA